MLFPIAQLVQERGEPLCVSQDTKLGDALALMVENDYSQLPVVNDAGHLTGIVSESSILSIYYHSEGAVQLLELPVHHCQSPAVTISPESDVFEALDLLKTVYAIVVVEEQCPIGILTNYDTTHFFRDISEDLIIVEDIELTLRQHIEDVFPDEHARCAALVRAFDQSKQEPSRPRYEYDELTFGQHILLIVTEGNWPKFEEFLGPKKLFKSLMDRVGEVRNQLAHFRGRPDPVQHRALLHARDWLAFRPKPTATEVPGRTTIRRADIPARGRGGKYAPLEDWLKSKRAQFNKVRLTFEDIEELIAEDLPQSAREHRSWWANDSTSHTQSLAWLGAGWRVDDVDLAAEEVVFQRTDSVLMQLFFADLLKRLKEVRPGLTHATKTYPQNWWNFGGGKTGFAFGWVFTGEDTLRVELYIDTGDKEQNKAAFDALRQQKDEIEAELGVALSWQRLDDKQAARI
ncbi:MAG: DUF4268 domain-containing protein, partial [Anaerolineae bacterium]